MIPERLWKDIPLQLMVEWAKSVHPYLLYPNGKQGPSPVTDPPQPFVDFTTEFIRSERYKVEDWQYWVGYHDETAPRGDGEWVRPFPHKHPDLRMRTMVLYLTAPERGGELVVFSRGTKHVITPKVGLTALITGHEEHGVQAVYGKTPRITAIANANVELSR